MKKSDIWGTDRILIFEQEYRLLYRLFLQALDLEQCPEKLQKTIIQLKTNYLKEDEK